jgi:hypothetical protein
MLAFRLVPDTHFKGWAKPGPVPPGARTAPRVPDEESLDAISGHFRIWPFDRPACEQADVADNKNANTTRRGRRGKNRLRDLRGYASFSNRTA